LLDLVQGNSVDEVYRVFCEVIKEQNKKLYSEEEVKEIIKLSCEKGMLIQRTINDKVKIPYTRIKDFTIKMLKQFKKK
jgi:predicted XRE-type DNA-binding protein